MPEKENIHKGHRQRMMKKYLDHGIDCFEDHEVLEILLYSCYTRRNTNDIAHDLIRTFGSLRGVLNAEYDELLEVDNIGPNAAATICFFKDLARRNAHEDFSGIILSESEDVRVFCHNLLKDCGIEVVHALFLDAAMALLSDHQISRGVTHQVDFDLKQIVSLAFKCKSSRVILVHNHPHGAAIASSADVATTRRIAMALRNVGIELLDHIIVCEDDSYSMRCAHLLPDIWFN